MQEDRGSSATFWTISNWEKWIKKKRRWLKEVTQLCEQELNSLRCDTEVRGCDIWSSLRASPVSSLFWLATPHFQHTAARLFSGFTHTLRNGAKTIQHVEYPRSERGPHVLLSRTLWTHHTRHQHLRRLSLEPLTTIRAERDCHKGKIGSKPA